MPIYEFKCERCKYRFECLTINPSHYPESQECPNCKKSDKVKRVPTAASIRFGEQMRSPNNPDAVAEANAERRKRRELKK
jgi:putative FmdB family regulatory protein